MRLALLLFFCLTVPAMAETACHAEVPCRLGDRSYHVREPDGWDGVTPLPVMLHFHGWARQGTLIVKHRRISGATRRRGVLLVAPNGLNKTWDFWRPGSRDTAFARAVLEDIRARYPILPERIFVSGYSWGANMAWRFVCEDGADVAALLAVSGTLEQDETCATAPGEVRQVYGLADTVLPFPRGPGGDEFWPVKLWRERLECNGPTPKGPWQQVSFLTLDRTVWEDCGSGRVSLDIHSGGHFIPHGWFARQLDELLGLPPSYP